MALNKPWSTLCLLSLSVPALGFGSPFWFFSSAPDTTCSKVDSCKKEKRAPEEMNKCEARCDELKCESPKACCVTKTVTDVITVCEDPCHPKHCNWDAALSFGIGYRHDNLDQKIRTHSSSAAAVNWKSHYEGVSSVMGVLRFDGRVSNFLFAFEGDYAPEVGANLNQSLSFPSNSAQNAHFKFRKLSGYEADAMASIGYRLEFINGKHGRAYLVPQVGYRYSHQAWETYSQDDYVNRALDGGNARQFLQDQCPMHSEWFGPFVEARLSFVFWNHMHVDPYYQYYFLDYRARKRATATTITIDDTLPGAISSQQNLMKALIHNDSARGQSAGVDLFWQFDNQVRLGAKGSWNMFETRKAKAHLKETVTTYGTNPPVTTVSHFKEEAHTGWTNYSIYLYAGYAF